MVSPATVWTSGLTAKPMKTAVVRTAATAGSQRAGFVVLIWLSLRRAAGLAVAATRITVPARVAATM
jgi:hypothetical protein